MSICRIYPVFVAGKRIEVRVHGALVLDPTTQGAILALIEAVTKLKRLDLGCQVVDPDVASKELQ